MKVQENEKKRRLIGCFLVYMRRLAKTSDKKSLSLS